MQQVRERDSLNAAGIPPQQLNGTVTSGSFDMSIFYRVYADVYQGVGAFALNASIFQGNNANGSDAAALPTAFFKSLNAANSLMSIECRADQLNYRYATISVISAGLVYACVIVRGTECRYPPANSFDNASVVAGRFFI
jgi:hypothetical protein